MSYKKVLMLLVIVIFFAGCLGLWLTDIQEVSNIIGIQIKNVDPYPIRN